MKVYNEENISYALEKFITILNRFFKVKFGRLLISILDEPNSDDKLFENLKKYDWALHLDSLDDVYPAPYIVLIQDKRGYEILVLLKK